MEIGELIGHYRISKQIGKGGMGNVYLALDTVNFRQVALKILPRIFSASRMLVARFLREMEVCRRLSHPNIVGFADAGLDRDQYYLCQEFINGVSLEELLSKSGPMELSLANSIMQDISYSLHAVHQQRIIHRDIKPQNIMLTEDRTVKLIDFGISLVKDTKIQQAVLAEFDRVGLRYRASDLKTQPGTVVGTPCYNSPEQNQARETTFASDIYSLGLVFYEMFTGVQVLPNSSLAKIIDFQAELDNQLIPISQVNPGVPAGIDEVIRKMIRYRPEERYQSASELVLALKDLHASEGQPAQEGGTKGAGKRLAQLELFETYYWKAMSLLSEQNFLDALNEFESLLNLNVGQHTYNSAIEETVNHLFWVVRPSLAKTTGNKGFRLAVDEYIECLVKMISIYKKLELDGHKFLVQRKFVATVQQLDDYEKALEYYDKIFSQCPDDVEIKRGYAKFLYNNGAISAGRCAQFDIIKQHYATKNFEESFEELKTVLQFEPDNKEVRDEQAQLEKLIARRAEERVAFLKKIDALQGTRELDFFKTAYEKSLEKYPDNVEILERLLNVYIDLNLEKMTKKVLCDLGRLTLDKNVELSKERFIQALLIDSKYSLAMSYLIVIFQDQGATFNDCPTYRDTVIKLFTMIGFFKEGIAEYEKKLKGTLQDLEVYEKMIQLYKRTGHSGKIYEIYFEMGKCALKNDQPKLSRDYFDEALERARNKQALYDQLRGIPNINKVYDLMKLVYSKQVSSMSDLRKAREEDDKGGNRENQLTSFIQNIRNRN